MDNPFDNGCLISYNNPVLPGLLAKIIFFCLTKQNLGTRCKVKLHADLAIPSDKLKKGQNLEKGLIFVSLVSL
ncbi:MAG TPA: hypothetical protein DDW36_00765 [Candidatus Magasanikbacteria bacterium]|nr:hypothetical protein [Candidatus Magasanikbacteria bacterium]